MAGWFRKTSWGGISGLALMEQSIHEDSGPLQVGDWYSQRLRGREQHNGIKGADNSAQTLEMGEKDEELGNLCSHPAPLSWTLRKWGPYLLPGSSPGGAGRALSMFVE